MSIRPRKLRLSPAAWPWVVLGLSALIIALAPAPLGPAAPATRLFRIQAHSFEYSPNVIAVNPGDTVTLELVSADYGHGLYVDGYGVSVSAEPGTSGRLTFVADRPGSFRFRCSVTCGPLHPFMIGKLVVGPDWPLLRAGGLAVLAAVGGLLLVRGRA